MAKYNMHEQSLELINAKLEKQLAQKNRELEIEAALERVRSRTMAMHQSTELSNTAIVLFEQLKLLGADLWSCGFAICTNENGLVAKWMSTYGNFIDRLDIPADNPGEQIMYNTWKNGIDIHSYVVEGEQLKKDYGALLSNPSVKERLQKFADVKVPTWQQNHIATFKQGYLLIITTSPFKETNIFSRFAKVFEQTYTRFLDLQKAEAQARESQIQLALERVRARTMAMQKSEELAGTAFLLLHQFKELGEHPDQATVGIINEEERVFEYWVTLHGNQSNRVYKFSIDEPHVTNKLYMAWKAREKSLVIDLGGKELFEFSNYRASMGGAAYNKDEKRRIINAAFFSHGLINVQSAEDRSAESINLLERFAAVFEGTYTRFLDLKKAEALAEQAAEDLIKLQVEKKRAEDALTELRVAQKQLIQSEKMASLGELTAGIAHEIQNPLNFVNNFSEVSAELVDELEGERQKEEGERDKELEDDILKDIKQNLEKIRHHGKRADGIVKGMLQHSRTSSGQKEPANINALADEYFKLSYHGLRAKDKSFNAGLIMNCDDKLPLISVISQDIGRVLLNLFNNAFYAVNQRQKVEGIGYKPEVSVSTILENGSVTIKVKDNGTGIPDSIKDKIMQPFFTTKPTGEGTGLGLSLSYDIIKAHGGSISVDSEEGEGTEFIIQLPVK